MGGSRFYDFVTGIETGPAPSATAPVANDDIVTLGSIYQIKGSYASPTIIDPAVGITPIANCRFQTHYVSGLGGPINITANPRIAAGDIDGEELTVIVSGANSVEIDNGNGIKADSAAKIKDQYRVTYKWIAGLGEWVAGPQMAAAGGGGGGGSLQWSEVGGAPAPTPAPDIFDEMYSYKRGEGQGLFTLFKVPSAYVPGSPINLRLDMESPDSSGTVLIQTTATLIRKGVDQRSTSTNQHTSTNAAVTLVAGTVSIPQEVICDLTDATGKINSVAVNPGDLLRIGLSRAADTGLSDVLVNPFAAEITII